MARSSWLAAQFLLAIAIHAQESHIPLNDGWQFQQVGKEQWYSAEVPGVVQTDLLRHGLIPDFYKGSNIDSVQWIENEDWIYKRTIVANDSLMRNGHVDLVFKGLDTFAEVYLNDSLLGKADNMFRTWEWPIKEVLNPGANELKVIFRSPIKEGAKLRDAYGIQLPHDNDPSGVSPYIRKAAYQFGWDFCPRLVTSGIWQGVELHCWSTAWIGTVSVEPDSYSMERPLEFEANFFTDGFEKAHLRVRYKVYVDDVLKINKRASTSRGCWGLSCTHVKKLRNTHFKPWFPNGSGEQDVHQLRVELWRKGKLLDTYSKPIALRTIELDQKTDSTGMAFQFRVNGEPIFAKGCNLIPPKMIPSEITTMEWLNIVRDLQRANMNMVRIWAGGIYPPEEFYAACDSAGIMVWQDLMFANLAPTGIDYAVTNTSLGREYLDNSLRELDDLAQRCDHHPSVVLWCGNNELDVAWKNWGWQQRYDLHGADSVRVTKVQEKFFGESIPDAFSGQPYLFTSPLSNWGNAEGLKNGDLHYWGVWHGDSAFSSFKNNVGRFVSEYGFQSYPDSALLSHYIDPKELYLGSPAMKRMQRSYKTDKPIWDAIKRELDLEPKTLGEFIEDSQEVQAKAYRLAIEAHMAAQPHCMGTLFWQLNDCWPGPSWSLIDFEGNWKPGMYEVQRLYAK